MKSPIAFVILLLSLAALVSSCQTGRGYQNGSRQKPGSCYRPGGPQGNNLFRYRREADAVVHTDEKKIEKRQIPILPIPQYPYGYGGGSQGGNGIIGSGGGSQGGNGWGSGRRCSNDYDCQGNKKCCSGNCMTPVLLYFYKSNNPLENRKGITKSR